jgi:hypothetical protein
VLRIFGEGMEKYKSKVELILKNEKRSEDLVSLYEIIDEEVNGRIRAAFHVLEKNKIQMD